MRTSLVDCLKAALFARVLFSVALMPGTCDTLTPSLLRNLHSAAGRSEHTPSDLVQRLILSEMQSGALSSPKDLSLVR